MKRHIHKWYKIPAISGYPVQWVRKICNKRAYTRPESLAAFVGGE